MGIQKILTQRSEHAAVCVVFSGSRFGVICRLCQTAQFRAAKDYPWFRPHQDDLLWIGIGPRLR